MVPLTCIGKVLGTLVVSLLFQIPVMERVILGLLMNTKGFIEIIVLNIGWEQKVLSDEVFSIMVLVTILMTTIISHTVALIHKPRKRHISYKNRTMQIQMGGGLTNLVRLKVVIAQEEGREASPLTPQSRPQADSRTVSQDLVSARAAGVTLPRPIAIGIEEEVVMVLPTEACRKRRKVVEGNSGENVEEERSVPSVIDQSFDAPVFIDQHILSGTTELFHDCDVASQAKSMYWALLRSNCYRL
ncbi:hypothetical protein Ahy_B05g074633 [Arachis hypogaea]|uniref:Cation/H+ exchanger domain-containing protein n=1 Tax=Arachis hypogaea TaxID=3818 RepID=A0A444YZE7_ARAHY|nr:hypothetical protein Ahy_B05g074633 [Arachis hypogaea]